MTHIAENKNIIIGIGTGRCGTNSVAKLLNSQPDSFFTHESYMLDWNMRLKDCEKWDNLNFILHRKEKFVGDVSLGLTSQAKELLLNFPTLKVFCLHRKKETLAPSLIRAAREGLARGRYQTLPSESNFDKDYMYWHKKFPAYDIEDKNKAVDMAISEYELITSSLSKEFTKKVFNLNIEDISNKKVLDGFFDFCGYDKSDRNYNVEKINIHFPDPNKWKNPEQVSIV